MVVLEGVAVGFASLLIIGALHPVVIKGEYYFGTRPWPAFLIAGAACLIGSLLINEFVISAILGLTGFTLLWTIKELFDQRKRVEKGWFPANPDRLAKERRSAETAEDPE